MDVTDDLPVAPAVEIVRGRQNVQPIREGMWRVSVAFHAQVNDPDSQQWTYAWDFGDSTFSNLSDPSHDFLVVSDHTYTVSLDVRDETGMWGHDTMEVRVDAGGFDPPVKMNFVGDVMLARAYDEPGGLIDQHGPEWMFIPTKPIFGDAADLSLCNNEMPFTDEGERHPTKSIAFRARPSNVAGLVYAGIDVVSLGNNHAGDYMRRGLEETIQTLDDAQIRWTGAGLDEYQAFTPAYWTERGISLGFLGNVQPHGARVQLPAVPRCGNEQVRLRLSRRAAARALDRGDEAARRPARGAAACRDRVRRPTRASTPASIRRRSRRPSTRAIRCRASRT